MEITAKQKMRYLDLYCMVLADGIIHPKEMETLYRIARERYGIPENEINVGVKEAGVSPTIPEQPEERIAVLYEMAVIAWADGEIRESERDLLRRYAVRYGVGEESIDELVDFLLERAQTNTPEEDVIDELNK